MHSTHRSELNLYRGGPFTYAPKHPANTPYKIKLGHARV